MQSNKWIEAAEEAKSNFEGSFFTRRVESYTKLQARCSEWEMAERRSAALLERLEIDSNRAKSLLAEIDSCLQALHRYKSLRPS